MIIYDIWGLEKLWRPREQEDIAACFYSAGVRLGEVIETRNIRHQNYILD